MMFRGMREGSFFHSSAEDLVKLGEFVQTNSAWVMYLLGSLVVVGKPTSGRHVIAGNPPLEQLHHTNR